MRLHVRNQDNFAHHVIVHEAGRDTLAAILNKVRHGTPFVILNGARNEWSEESG
jgi:hypothetical protein